MESTRFSMNLRKQQPRKKVVSFEDYCQNMDGAQDNAVSEAALLQRIRRRGARRNLEILCLLLEAGACMAAMVVLLSVSLRLFGR